MKEKIKELKEGGRYLLSRIGRMSGKYEIIVLEESKTHWKIKYENDNTEWIDKKSRIDIIEALNTPSEPSDEVIKSKAYEIVMSQYTEPITDLKGGMQFEREVSMFSLGMKHFRDNYQQPQVDWDVMKKDLENEIKHIFDSGANEIRIYNMVKLFIERRFKSQLQKED